MAWLQPLLPLLPLLIVFHQLQPHLQPPQLQPRRRVPPLPAQQQQPELEVRPLPAQQPQLETPQQLLELQAVEKVWMLQQSRLQSHLKVDPLQQPQQQPQQHLVLERVLPLATLQLSLLRQVPLVEVVAPLVQHLLLPVVPLGVHRAHQLFLILCRLSNS